MIYLDTSAAAKLVHPEAESQALTVFLAARLTTPLVSSALDALHLATAAIVASQLDAFITYDKRLAEAAAGIGLEVTTPS